MTTTYAYLRVSTAGQAANGYGLDTQREAIAAWAESNRTAVSRTFADEGVSGKLANRPALAELLATVEPNDTVVFARLDRFARDLIVQEILFAEFRRRGARLVSCDAGEDAFLADDPNDPSRKLVRQIVGAIAEYERELFRLRSMAGKAAKRANGGYVGGPAPFGFDVIDGGLVRNETEQRVLDVIAELRTGGASWRQVAAECERLGLRTRAGTPFEHSNLRRLGHRHGLG